MEHGLGRPPAPIPPPNGTDFRRVPVTGTPQVLPREGAKVSPRHRNFPQADQRVKVSVPSAATSGASSGKASASARASASAVSWVGRAAVSSACPAGVTSV